MNAIINFLAAQAGRFLGWLFGTRNGWIFFAVVIFAIMMKFQPELLAQTLSSLCAGVLNLLARIIQANQPALEYLFCIAISCAGIVLMLRGVFGKRGGTQKK